MVLNSSFAFAVNTLKRAEIKNDELNLVFSSYINRDDIHELILTNPPRHVIDIKNTRLKSYDIVSALSSEGVRSFRVGEHKNSVVRIVIETNTPYKAYGYQPMASRNIYTITLPKSSNISFNTSRKYAQQTVAPAKRVKKNQPTVKERPKVKLQKPAEPITAPKKKTSIFSSLFSSKSTSKSTSSSSSLKKTYTIVVDAGHGGKDSGAIGARRYYEKVIVLQIAKRVEKYLKKKRFRVKMTRTNDRYVKLKNRTKFANRHKADIFISIHANAIANKRRYNKVYGVETYFLQTTRSARSKRIAAKENSVVLNKNDFLSNNVILNAVLSGPKIELSHKLAIDVQSRMIRNLKQRYRGVKDGGVRPAPFWVLVGAQMPSILIEVGYITNPTERARLFKADYQNRIAKGIAEGVSNYLTIREREFN